MEVVLAAEGFMPEHVANALGHTWNIDGLTLQLVDAQNYNRDDNVCPITCCQITKAGMTADGFAYQMGSIMQ